jgi:hypothetical protein
MLSVLNDREYRIFEARRLADEFGVFRERVRQSSVHQRQDRQSTRVCRISLTRPAWSWRRRKRRHQS